MHWIDLVQELRISKKTIFNATYLFDAKSCMRLYLVFHSCYILLCNLLKIKLPRPWVVNSNSNPHPFQANIPKQTSQISKPDQLTFMQVQSALMFTGLILTYNLLRFSHKSSMYLITICLLQKKVKNRLFCMQSTAVHFFNILIEA